MAFTFGFYNSMRGDRKYNADQVGALFDGLLNDGVYASIGEVFATVPGEGMSVVVKTGRAWFNRTWNENNSHMILTLSESNVLLPRFDAVVLEVDKRDTVRQNRIIIVEGTPSANPVHPNLINNAEVGFFQHPLAYVKVDPNVIAIAPDKIQIVVGTAQCPFVTGILRLSSIDDLYQGWEYQFQEWWKGIKALLNENTVGRLQTQIDERVKYTDKVDVNNLGQILSDDNAHWMTPASTKKAIAQQAYPPGSTSVPGQNPNDGSWSVNNGLYVSNMSDGPLKTALVKAYGYFPVFHVYETGENKRNITRDGSTYDHKNGTEVFTIGALAFQTNRNSSILTQISRPTGSPIFFDGDLGWYDNGTGVYNWRGIGLSLGGGTLVDHFYPDPSRLTLILYTSSTSLRLVTIGTNGGILNNSTIPTSMNIVSYPFTFACVKNEQGVMHVVGPSGADSEKLDYNRGYKYKNVWIFNANSYTFSLSAMSSLSGVLRELAYAYEYELNSKNIIGVPSTDYNSVWVGNRMITNRNGSKTLWTAGFSTEFGGLRAASLGAAPFGTEMNYDLNAPSGVSMGLADIIPPWGIRGTARHNYTTGGRDYIYGSNLLSSDYKDASMPLSGGIPDFGYDWYDTSGVAGISHCPTVLSISYQREHKYTSDPERYFTVIIKLDPTKIPIPYDPAKSIRYG